VILLLYGPDELAMRRRFQELRDQADGGSGMLMSNLTVLEGRDVKAEDIIAPAMSMPFLAPHRLVIVEQFFERFQARGPVGEDGEARLPRNFDAFAPLFLALERGLPPTTILVFTGLNAGARNPMLDRLKKIPGVQVEELKKLEKEALLRFIRDEAAARSIRLKPGPSRRRLEPGEDWLRPAESDPALLLAQLHQSDTLAIVNELDKLALYTMGRDATVDDIDLICGGERDRTIFNFTDAVMDGDLKLAFAILEHFERVNNDGSQGMISMLASAYRRLVVIVDLLDDGATPDEIGTAINMKWPGLRDRAIARARRLGPSGVRAAFAAIVAADRTMKLGEVEEDLTIEILVHQLTALARPALR